MGTNLSTIAGALKRVYDKKAKEQQNLKHRAIDEIANSEKKYNAGGEGFFGAINDYGNESVGAINETESFRTIDNEHYAQWKVSPKVLVAPINISGLAAKAADSDDEAFVNAAIDALDKAKERLLKDENRQFFGLGNGLLASPTGAVASNLTSFTVDSAQYLRANMVIDIFQSTTKTVDSIRVSDVDKTSNVVYLATSLGAALTATSQLVKENVRDSAPTDGKEAMGLRGIVDDATDLTTFQNIAASASRIWRGRRIDASSGNLSSDLLQRLCDDVQVLSGEMVDTIIMHPKQRRKYLDIVVPQKRYMDQDMDSGFKKLSFNGIELWLDPDCQDDTVYAVKKAELRKFEVAPLEMGGLEGSDKFLRSSGSDVFEAYWRHYMNFGVGRRNCHGKIVSLAKPTGVS
jgi:hypothetical protein